MSSSDVSRPTAGDNYVTYVLLPMTDQDEAKLCNSSKNHLGYDPDEDELPQDHDVEAGTSIGEGAEGEGAEGENPEDNDEAAALSAKDKIPAIYQVDPGCTPLACYSAILTSIVMCIGVLWLLLISPAFNVNTEYAPFPTWSPEILNRADSYPDIFVLRTSTEPSSNVTELAALLNVTESIDQVTTTEETKTDPPPPETTVAT